MKIEKLLVKVVASVLIFSFSSSQILWAADARQMILDAKAYFDEQDALRPHGLTSTDLAANQTSQQAVIAQQQALQDFQNTNFSLSTPSGDTLKYVGDKLKEVERPDGTKLANIVTDAVGNIQNADLRLADGSIQVYQNGQVIGYMTPDGTQVLYTNGVATQSIDKLGGLTNYTYLKDAQGKITETTLDGPTHVTKYDTNGKIKEATRKSDNQKIYYTGGIINKIVNSDGSQILFNSSVVNGDTVVTPQGNASDVYIDAQGNKFYFTGGSVSKVVLPDNAALESITWDANNKVDSATLTQTDLQKFVYQSKLLTRSYDAAGVVTNYTTTANGVTAVSAGNTWEYLADLSLSKFTDLTGNVTTYLTTGTYKGLKDREVLSTGVTYVYEYQGTGTSITVQKREVQASVYNIITFDGQANMAQSTNPAFRTTVQFPSDGSIDQSVVITATYSTTKNLRLNVVSGTGSTYTFNNVTTSLGVTLNNGTNYKVEMIWESGRVGIYIYAATSAKPSTPTKSITDRAWDPRFKAVATNTAMLYDGTSSGYFNRNIDTRTKGYAYLPGSPVMKVDFNRIAANYKTILFKATQAASGNVTRTLSYWLDEKGMWYYGTSDYNSSTGVTTSVNGSLAQNIPAGVNYTAELRIENGKANLYVYEKTLGRPAAPTISLNAFNVSTILESSLCNATGQGAQFKNLTAPVYSASTFQGKAITSRVNTVKNLTLVKATAPTGLNLTDFTSITYDALANLKQAIFKDGSKLVFDQGILKQAFDAAGKSTTFDFVQSGLSNIIGSRIVQSNLTSTYSAAGKLASIKVNDITTHYKTDGSAVEWIEKTDGTEIYNMVFDASGNLKDALIVAPDGEERQYTAGKLASLRRSDQTQLLYANDKPLQLVTPEKITYNFTFTPTAIEAALPAGAVVDALTPIKMEYDLNYNLKKVTRQNQEVINYLNNQINSIDTPNTASKVFAYQKDTAGNILSYTVTQGNVVTTYDANNQPVSAVINAITGNPDTFNITYQYGKMREVKKNNAVAFKYSYTFDSAGKEFAQVDDVAGNATKIYDGVNLISTLDKATNVLSSYEYASDKVSKVAVSRFGRSLHSYDYSYSGADTIVTDETGVIRTYDASQKMIFLEKNGEKFAYSTVAQTIQGSPVTTQTVLPVTTFGTAARSAGPNYWEQWVTNTAEAALEIGSNGWLKYDTNLSQPGDLKIEFDSSNFGGTIPANYQFKLDIAVDGVVKTQYLTPLGTGWKTNALTLAGLSQGAHSITISWVNDYYVANQYDANFRFRNLKMTQISMSASTTTENITVEQLVAKKLSDGSTSKYAAGKITEIDYTDGRALKNFVKASDGSIAEARLFANAQDLTGTKLEFVGGLISKATLASGQVLTYNYEKDASGNVTATWVKKGTAVLKYDSTENMQSVKIDGVMTPAEVQAAAIHSFVGGVGALSIDGDFQTAQTVSASCGGCGGSGGRVTSEHSFSFTQSQVVKDVTFRSSVLGYASGNYIRDYNASYSVEVLRNGMWQIIPGSSWGCSGGGNGQCAQDSGIVTLTGVNLDNVTALHAVASGFGNASGGEGNSGGSASIYEIQFTLADLANLSYSQTTDAAGQVTGYQLSGYKGQMKFDASGAVTLANANYTSVQQDLAGVIQNYTKTPFKNSDFMVMKQTLADTETTVSQEYAADGTLEVQTKADGTVTTFESNKPSKVLDAAGEILIQYSYDANGNPTRIFLKNARDKLPDEVLKATESIQSQRADTLRTLAQQKNLAYQSIQSAYQTQRQSIQNSITALQGQYDQVAGTDAKGKKAKNARGDALNSIGAQMDQAHGLLATSYDNEADSYAALDSQVKTVSDQIEADTAKALTDLSTQEATMKKEILRQETSPIIYDSYRRILGRDPDSAEYSYWIGQIDYASGSTFVESKTLGGVNFAAAVNSYVSALPELATRQTYVNTIKSAVTTEINNYLAMTQAQKEAYAAALGLTAQDLIPLSSADGQSILSWINSRSLHFGQSAFIALETLLDQKAKVYTRETLARQCILVDVLTGVISPLDDGDLVISMYALNKVGGLYGVSLQGANLTWADLQKIYQTNPTARVIAHVRDNHYVIVTGITATTITYIDPGKGKDKQNEVVTLLKSDFLKGWKGNITLDQAAYNTVKAASTTVTALTKDQTQSIRGAFFFFFIPALISAFLNIGGAVWAVVNGIGTIIASIGTLVGNVVTSIGQALATFGQGLSYIGNAIFQGMSFAASSLFNAIGNVGTFLSQNVFGSIAKAGFGNTLFQTAVKVGFSVATQKGLEALGVNSTIASLASAFVSGGITGGFNAGFTAANFIQSGLKALALQGTQLVMQNAGIDSTLSQTLLTVASPIIDGIQTGNIAGATVKIIQDLPKNLSFYGLSKVGENIGLSPLVAQSIASPISAVLGAGMQTGNVIGQNLIQSIQQGITQGVVAYGLDLVSQRFPALGSLLSTDVVRQISSAIGSSGLFDSIFKVIQKAILLPVNIVGGFISKSMEAITNFGTQVQQKGLISAIQDKITSIFDRNTLEEIQAKGGLQNAYNTATKQTVTLQTGQQAQEVKLTSQASLYLDASGNMIGKKENGVTQIGTLSTTSQGFGLRDGSVYADMGNSQTMTSQVKDGQVMNVRIDGPQGEVLEVKSDKATTPIYIEGPKQPDPNGSLFNIWNAVLVIAPLAMSIVFGNGVATATESVVSGTPGQIISAVQGFQYALANGVANPNSDPTKAPDYIANLKTDLTQKSNPPINPSDIFAIPLYNRIFKYQVTNQVYDALRWAIEAQLSGVYSELSTSAIDSLSEYYWTHQLDLTRSLIGMGYSGGFMPLVEAVAYTGLKFESLVALGAATFDFSQNILNAIIGITTIATNALVDIFQNVVINNLLQPYFTVLGISGQKVNDVIDAIQTKNLDRTAQLMAETLTNLSQSPGVLLKSLVGTSVNHIANVWGTKDILVTAGLAGKRTALCGVATTNIEIFGADHFDYMLRGPSDLQNPPDTWNRTVSDFVAKLIPNTGTPGSTETYLRSLPITVATFNSTRNVWEIKLQGWDLQ